MEHPERSKELCLQLPVTLGLDIFAIQSYFVIGDIASRLNAFVVGLLLKFLGMVEVLSANKHQFS